LGGTGYQEKLATVAALDVVAIPHKEKKILKKEKRYGLKSPAKMRNDRQKKRGGQAKRGYANLCTTI